MRAATPLQEIALPFTAVIKGAPRTKKNSNRRLRRGTRTFTVPSEAYESWDLSAQAQLQKVIKGAPITSKVNCRAVFLREKNAGDACNYYQALADTLEHAGVVKNDVLIVSWDGTRMDKDAKNPRVIVTLEAAC